MKYTIIYYFSLNRPSTTKQRSRDRRARRSLTRRHPMWSTVNWPSMSSPKPWVWNRAPCSLKTCSKWWTKMAADSSHSENFSTSLSRFQKVYSVHKHTLMICSTIHTIKDIVAHLLFRWMINSSLEVHISHSSLVDWVVIKMIHIYLVNSMILYDSMFLLLWNDSMFERRMINESMIQWFDLIYRFCRSKGETDVRHVRSESVWNTIKGRIQDDATVRGLNTSLLMDID